MTYLPPLKIDRLLKTICDTKQLEKNCVKDVSLICRSLYKQIGYH